MGKSSKLVVNYGVPQGIALGPVLLILYLNDIISTVRYCKMKLLADDTMIHVNCNNIFQLAEYLNENLAKMYEYLQLKIMLLNIN